MVPIVGRRYASSGQEAFEATGAASEPAAQKRRSRNTNGECASSASGRTFDTGMRIMVAVEEP